MFPLGEELGWRGFAHPRMVLQRHGVVRGALIVGIVWGLWHLMYTITPTAAGFDPIELGTIMTELPLYALLIAWVFERANRSLAVAIAFHAGAHLDHIERAPRTDLRLQLLHLAVLGAFAVAAGWSLSRRWRARSLRLRSGVASQLRRGAHAGTMARCRTSRRDAGAADCAWSSVSSPPRSSRW